jgi:hypothetical protein
MYLCRYIKIYTTVKVKRLYSKKCREGRKRHLRQPNFSKVLTKLAIFPNCERTGLKNWVAAGVASDPHDTSCYIVFLL